ncbi:MAG: maleylpyruvate isomerase family mycothiol-dependent enzyme [Actinomycetota bacterium]
MESAREFATVISSLCQHRLMDTADFLRIFDIEHEAFLASCERAGSVAKVPSCPGWSVSDLLYHLYEVQYAWRRVTAEGRTSFSGIGLPDRPDDNHLAAVVRSEHDNYSAMLRGLDPGASIWTWIGTRDVAWLARRMAHETAMHRVDADLAAGVAAPIEASLASDGIDEFFEIFLNPVNGAVNGSVHIHCTDVAGEWTVREVGGAFDVRREHAKGDAAIRGAANDILMALWRRGPLSACDVVGDAEAAARFVAASQLE